MSISMQNKVVLLTGGARGIGAAMATTFAAAGAKVMLSDVLEDAGRATAEAIRKGGGQADFVEHDVRAEPAWQAAIAATISRFGTLTTVVNNAGIEVSAPIAELSISDLVRTCSNSRSRWASSRTRSRCRPMRSTGRRLAASALSRTSLMRRCSCARTWPAS